MRLITHSFLFVLFAMTFLQNIALAQIKSYDFEDLDSLQRIDQRNVVIFIHTDWCKYCQMMKNTTFKSKQIIDLLNSKFYFISHDGEEKREITVFGKKFHYAPTGLNTGTHQLTKELATIENAVSYPTICILNPEREIVLQKNEYLSTADFMNLISLNE